MQIIFSSDKPVIKMETKVVKLKSQLHEIVKQEMFHKCCRISQGILLHHVKTHKFKS